MIYLRADATGKVGYQHFKPFHDRHGLKTSREELELTGIFVDELPEQLPIVEGKKNVLYINPLRWEYENVVVVLTQEEKLAKMVEDGVLTQEQADDLLNK